MCFKPLIRSCDARAYPLLLLNNTIPSVKVEMTQEEGRDQPGSRQTPRKAQTLCSSETTRYTEGDYCQIALKGCYVYRVCMKPFRLEGPA